MDTFRDTGATSMWAIVQGTRLNVCGCALRRDRLNSMYGKCVLLGGERGHCGACIRRLWRVARCRGRDSRRLNCACNRRSEVRLLDAKVRIEETWPVVAQRLRDIETHMHLILSAAQRGIMQQSRSGSDPVDMSLDDRDIIEELRACVCVCVCRVWSGVPWSRKVERTRARGGRGSGVTEPKVLSEHGERDVSATRTLTGAHGVGMWSIGSFCGARTLRQSLAGHMMVGFA